MLLDFLKEEKEGEITLFENTEKYLCAKMYIIALIIIA